jgi:hypothetical protein
VSIPEENLADRIGDFNIPDEIDEMYIKDEDVSSVTNEIEELDEQELYACVDRYLCDTQIVYKGWHGEIAAEIVDDKETDEYLMTDYFRDLDECETRIDDHVVTCAVEDNGVEFLIDHYVVGLSWTELAERIKTLVKTGAFPVLKPIETKKEEPQSFINVLVVEPEKKPHLIAIPRGNNALQEKVGGSITTIEIGDGIDAICADDVSFENTPINRMINGQPIFGTFVVARVDYRTGKYESLKDADIQKYMAKFVAPLIDITRLVSEYEEMDEVQGDAELDEEGIEDDGDDFTQIEDNSRFEEKDTFILKPVSNQQMTLFDMVDTSKDKETELIEYIPLEGSQVVGGKQRIYDFALTCPAGSAFEKMLKNEYGIGGHTVRRHGISFENHDGKGILFDWTDDKGEKRETKITWLRATIVIQRLIDQGRYLENTVPTQTLEAESTDESAPITQPVSKPRPVKTNFRYSEVYNLYPGGEKTKYKNNVEAIKLLKKIESEKRLATPDEQIVLARYVGWEELPMPFQIRPAAGRRNTTN